MIRSTLLCLLLAVLALTAWHPQDDDYNIRYNKWKRLYAKEQIKALKEGVLLVRLQTRNKSIELHRKNGNPGLANQIEDDQYQENKAIMAAFGQHFNFAPVYFFYADDTDKIKSGQTSGLFLNAQMKPDAAIQPKLDFFMVAEFGPLEGETRVIPGDTLVPLPDYVPGEVLERALVVRDQNFMQMRDPFPYYTRAANRNKPEKSVTKLNDQLHLYFKNATK